MLKTRVLTALALLPVVLGMLFLASSAAWTLFAAAIAMLGLWEWSRLCGMNPGSRWLFNALSLAGTAALVLASLRAPAPLFANVVDATLVASAYFWLFAVPLWLGLRLRPEPWACALAGWLVIWPFWSALVRLREAGPLVLLGAALLVWIADIAAYFAGRRYGRHKLAPAVSPGKTWEGVAGGLAGVLAYGLALGALATSQGGLLARLFDGAWAILALAAMVALAVLSVLGDLFESWMKRGAGRKDSSALLPGHGGVLDRVDALTSSLPVAALLVGLA